MILKITLQNTAYYNIMSKAHKSTERMVAMEELKQLKDFYEKKGKLFIVEGQEEVADTSALVLKALEE